MSTTTSTMTRSVQSRRDADEATLARAINEAERGTADLDLTDLTGAGSDPDTVDVAVAPTSLADISCWRLLTARVPLTLLVDLALPDERLNALHEEMLAEHSSVDWIPQQRR